MGSVKDLEICRPPTFEASGVGRFSFSDRYSVFDWGEMPDHIQNKGASLCLVSAYFFERLEEMGIKTHYRGVVEHGEVKRLAELTEPATSIKVSLLRVIKPPVKGKEYDYSVYQKERANFLIPLEIIYRRSLPAGSSIFRRLREGSLKPEDLGLKEPPFPGQILKIPLLDVSTKLEASDRYISWEEARKIAGLNKEELEEIKKTALLISELITKEAGKRGLVNEDGKVEFGFDENRKLMVVDVLGTLDECRFTFGGIPVSKEIARIYYQGTDWYHEIEKAKKKDKVNWRVLVKDLPPPLPQRLKDLIAMAYCASANEVTGRLWFKNLPPLPKIVQEIRQVLR